MTAVRASFISRIARVTLASLVIVMIPIGCATPAWAADENLTPDRVIQIEPAVSTAGAVTLGLQGIAVDAAGNTYVTLQHNEPSSPIPGEIYVYGPTASGTVPPSRVISSYTPSTGLALGSNNLLYLCDGYGLAYMSAVGTNGISAGGIQAGISPSVNECSAAGVDASNNVFYTSTLPGIFIYPATDFVPGYLPTSPQHLIRIDTNSSANGIAVNPDGSFWISNVISGAPSTTRNSLQYFPSGADSPSSVLAPDKIIGGDLTGLTESGSWVYGMAVAPNGNIVVGVYNEDHSKSKIEFFDANASGNVPPLRVIRGSNTGFVFPKNITFNAAGDLYVSDFYGGRISVFLANHATPTPTPTPALASTGINADSTGLVAPLTVGAGMLLFIAAALWRRKRT